jgi:hypothetical protein
MQVNLAPTDLRHVREILPHELRQLGQQVDEVLLVIDLNRNPLVDPVVWSDGERGLREFLAGLSADHPHLRVIDVDDSPQVAAQVSDEFFGGEMIPAKDWRGAPIYPYFFGLWAARNNYVLHMDSDMLYGGGSQTWVAEAVELLRSRPDVLVCSPLPGPPRADGTLTTQTLPREPHATLAFRADGISTRIFMIDRARFRDRVGRIAIPKPTREKRLLALVDGYTPHDPAEQLMSLAMNRGGLARIDFLGTGEGMWSLHPPYRGELFYSRLPWLIGAIERGEVSEAQRGDFDVNDSMIDWSGVRPTRRDRVRWHLDRIRLNVQTHLRIRRR